MIVIILTAVPQSLKGHVSLYLHKINSNVYAGDLPARVRGMLWQHIENHHGKGTASIVWMESNRLRFLSTGDDYLDTQHGMETIVNPLPDQKNSNPISEKR